MCVVISGTKEAINRQQQCGKELHGSNICSLSDTEDMSTPPPPPN